jgi:two-component system alkaline phosphatase synthesis response regulator PhoP
MGRKILVVDDDRDLVESLGEALEMEGFNVVKAYDGVQCWDKIKGAKPDLIVLDVMMPNKDGYKVAEELAQSEYSNIPLIMLTGVSEHMRDTNFSRAQGLSCEADDYLPKPVKAADLIRSVKRLVKK